MSVPSKMKKPVQKKAKTKLVRVEVRNNSVSKKPVFFNIQTNAGNFVGCKLGGVKKIARTNVAGAVKNSYLIEMEDESETQKMEKRREELILRCRNRQRLIMLNIYMAILTLALLMYIIWNLTWE